MGSGRSFCIGGVFCYSVRFGSMYEYEELLGSVFWFLQKLSIRYIVMCKWVIDKNGLSSAERFSYQNQVLTLYHWLLFCIISDVSVQYRDGLPVVSIPLPSRKEHCEFTLKPVSHTVGDFIKFIKEEDGGVDRASIYKEGNMTKSQKVMKSSSLRFRMVLYPWILNCSDNLQWTHLLASKHCIIHTKQIIKWSTMEGWLKM